MEKVPLDFGFRRYAFIFTAFFILTPLTLIGSIVALFHTITPKPEVLGTAVSVPLLSALPPESDTKVSITTESADARVEIVRQYLQKYNSPLLPYADLIVKTADQYKLDFRLLPAIAQQESNLCRFIPDGTHNCWGWGIHKRGTLGFESYEEAIDIVGRGLREDYLNRGLETPEEIMSKYTPSSPGSWAAGVTAFMSDME